MSTPPGGPPYINPFTGRTVSRDYYMRMMRGAARGLSRESAAGQHARPAPAAPSFFETPWQRRKRISLEQYGLTPSQKRTKDIHDAYGISYNRYLKIRPYLERIKEMAPDHPIEDWMVEQAAQFEEDGLVDKYWIERQLQLKTEAMESYRNMSPSERTQRRKDHTHVGYALYVEKVEYMPAEWWWYH